MTMIQFTPKAGGLDNAQIIPRHTPLDSEPTENGAMCTFLTAHDITIYPMTITAVDEALSREKCSVFIDLHTLNKEAFDTLSCDTLDFFLSGEKETAMALYQWLFCHLDQAELIIKDNAHTLSPNGGCN